MNNSQEFSLLSSPMRRSQIAFLRASLDTQQSNSRSNKIADLYSKFVTLNSQVTVDHDLSAFNLIEYDHKDIKMDFDRELVQAKLKRLENNAELKRINMELEHRRKKKLKTKNKDQQDPQILSYLNTYRQIQEDREKQQQSHQVHTDSQQQNIPAEGQKPSGIRYYSELRRHPKILDYTVSLACSRQLQRREEVTSKSQKREDYKKQIQQARNHLAPPSQLIKPSTPPQKLAENIFRRIYTKRNKERPIQQVRRQGRLTKFMNRQQDIIDSLDSKTISKDLYKKLKQRLHDIATEIYINQKKFEPRKETPRITLNNTSFRIRK